MILSLPAFSCYRQKNPQKSTLCSPAGSPTIISASYSRRRVYLFVATGVKAAGGFWLNSRRKNLAHPGRGLAHSSVVYLTALSKLCPIHLPLS